MGRIVVKQRDVTDKIYVIRWKRVVRRTRFWRRSRRNISRAWRVSVGDTDIENVRMRASSTPHDTIDPCITRHPVKVYL